MTKTDISAVITFHNEGPLARLSLKSAVRAKALAQQRGLGVQIVAVLDRADQRTLECIRGDQAVDELVEVSHGDPGLARNSGILAAKGEWIALLDGDDLWAGNWLADAHAFARTDTRLMILHPQVTAYFGPDTFLFTHMDMEDDDFDLLNLSMSNYWTILTFARRETHLQIPFGARRLDRQLGFEDWGWNCETISRGFLHKIVPSTMHAVRVKNNSVVRRDIAAKALPLPTSLFRDRLPKKSP